MVAAISSNSNGYLNLLEAYVRGSQDVWLAS